MGSPNGGIIGVVNPTSFGKCTQTIATASTCPRTAIAPSAAPMLKLPTSPANTFDGYLLKYKRVKIGPKRHKHKIRALF